MRRLLQLALILILTAPAWAAIAFDASGSGTGTTTLSWTHTPVGTPKGVFVFCIADGSSTDVFSGATYGGTGMTRIASASDTVGETGFTEGYFLGASIPTGAQTVACTVSSGSTSKFGVSITVTAASNTQTSGTGSCTVSEDAANPSCSVTGIAGASYAAAAVFSGQNAPSSISAGSGFTIGPTNDFGTQSAGSERNTSQLGSGNQTIAFTIGSDDVAMVGIAIEQVTPDAASTKLPLLGVGP